MVVAHVDGAARRLCQRRDAELQTVVGPGLFLESEELAEFFLGAAQAGFEATQRFVTAEPVRDGDNQRLAHWPYMGTVFRRSNRHTIGSHRFGTGHEQAADLHRTARPLAR